jgi:hypothetical protein
MDELEKMVKEMVVAYWRCYVRIYLEGLKENTKHHNQDSMSSNLDLSPGAPKYKAGVLAAQPWYLVKGKRSRQSLVSSEVTDKSQLL